MAGAHVIAALSPVLFHELYCAHDLRFCQAFPDVLRQAAVSGLRASAVKQDQRLGKQGLAPLQQGGQGLPGQLLFLQPDRQLGGASPFPLQEAAAKGLAGSTQRDRRVWSTAAGFSAQKRKAA